MEPLTGTVKSVLDYASIVKTIITLDPGQRQPIKILNWDHRRFAAAFEGGLTVGARVTIHTAEDGTEAVELE